ncbi:uncharacterized protein BJ171DRAFT_488370 [Polychytrium aggregatum]|uniref:uncharacterized protein n=1 Tax=Polychytrium aggregatum TaxID=110093 RepID=UPI0022FED600|nr:uncharacterized protein BJ171DRAFT_488370 [Polychytrium aggregatum]KAI9209066.1 hypothetical protein BJ171DRAFT_488370 [Polychytrium aggregatum]
MEKEHALEELDDLEADLDGVDREALIKRLKPSHQPPKRICGWQEIADRIYATRGLWYMVLSSASFTGMSLSMKILSNGPEPLPLFEAVFFRTSLVWIMAIATLYLSKAQYIFSGPPGVRMLLLFRGILGFSGLSCSVYALSCLSVAESTVLGFMSPSFTGILAIYFLKEPWGLKDAVCTILSLVGVIFVAHPEAIFGKADPFSVYVDDDSAVDMATAETPSSSGTSPSSLGVVVALAGACFSAGIYVIIRKIGDAASAYHIIAYFSAVGAVFACIGGAVMPNEPWILPQLPTTYMHIAIIGISGFVGQIFFSSSLQLVPAGRAATMNYAQVLFAFLADWLLFNVRPGFWSIIGTALIGSCLIFIATSKSQGAAKSTVEKRTPSTSELFRFQSSSSLL